MIVDSEDDWANKSAEEMAQKISLDPPKTEYAKQRESEKNSVDKMTNHWMETIDSMDPNLSSDMTSEYINVQKTQAEIKRLERKIEAESKGFEHLEEYQQDKLMLDNLKQQISDDATQDVEKSIVETAAWIPFLSI